MGTVRIATAVALGLYWLVLFIISLDPIGLEPPDYVLPVLVLLAPPVLLVAGLREWRRQRSDMSGLAYQDELTGLANRRAFTVRARSLLRKARPGSVGLLLMDVDGLKRINDECGHQAGDELLTLAARKLSCAPGELFRIGGDELALLLARDKGDSMTQALRQVEPFRVRFETCGHEHEVRISYGFASNNHDSSLEHLFQVADARLREHKRQLYASGKIPDRRERPTPEILAPPVTADVPGGDGLAPVLSLDARRRASSRQSGAGRGATS